MQPRSERHARRAAVLDPHRLGLGAQLFGARGGLLDAPPALFQDVLDRPVEKALQDPDEDQEIDDLEQEGGGVQFHGCRTLMDSRVALPVIGSVTLT